MTTATLPSRSTSPSRPAGPFRAGRARATTATRTLVTWFALAAASAVVLLPLAWMLSASLRTQGDLVGSPSSLIPTNVTFENYVEIWQLIPFGRLFLNTVVFAGVVACVSVVIDAMAGYALARFDFPGRTFVFVALVATLLVPIQVTFVPVYSLLIDLGWVNTLHGLIVPRIADAFGIFFLRQYFLALPKDLEDAARIDGASEVRIFRSIMFPLAGPALLTIFMFNLVGNWNDLLWPLIVMSDPQSTTLPVGLALFRGQHVIEYGPLMAGSVLALIPMVIAFVVVQRRFIESIATTGIK
ncbi:binding-protein-dependent transport systems inner membrane component [Beutenbergia cavernae DSM 12333]|uniref:Binding-protein-dependent transport systems inner membrane component n=1 Tax=Beutenbergia cavernae (strain ATCC BAA-8 / DSM 12333 / CCUG 43141 / JCM 11478 / NBRC 16432 / NCIMB 13614 / HKI 0122) TaxID=471853 RepID=C5C381_BEUC1|nr:carbohydrate ABC transporter permease [Beutenbergia cavernae]ACQ79780.1 binding-protein-dependent transport systems inner membrane component [Beutenbergia cavernae DSM 12333]